VSAAQLPTKHLAGNVTDNDDSEQNNTGPFGKPVIKQCILFFPYCSICNYYFMVIPEWVPKIQLYWLQTSPIAMHRVSGARII